MVSGQAEGLPREALEKTGAEQSIIRNLQALEQEFSEEQKPERKAELRGQIETLKEQLAFLQGGPTYETLEIENERLRKQLLEAQKRLERVLSECNMLKDSQSSLKAGFLGGDSKNDARCALYRALIKKYSDIINESEKKTVGELKALVNYEDLSVQSFLESIKEEKYSYKRNFLSAAKKAFEFMQGEVQFAKSDLGLNFWLSPKEILKEKVGDDEDLAVFLCSVLYGLGDENAAVVIAEMGNLTTHTFVVTEYSGRFMLLDPTQKEPFERFIGEKEKVIKEYSFEGAAIKRFLYKFNSKIYEQFI